MLTPKEYRDREVMKLVDEAFHQFNISDPNEKRDISNSIKEQLDTSNPVSSYEESDIALSSIYRANVRTALIDIISHILYVKDLETNLSQLEGVSRNMISEVMNSLIEFQAMLIRVTGTIKESFTEGLDHGKYQNTIVKEGKLRVNYADLRATINDISIISFPSESVFDNVSAASSNNENVLIDTGIGSDLYRFFITSKTRPSVYVNESFFKGVVLTATLETEACLPASISAKAGSSFKIALWEGYNHNTLEWEELGTDNTFGYYSFIDTTSSTVYSKYRVSLLFPDYIIKNNLYQYDILLHNIKLFKKDALVPLEKGSFVSHVYPIGDHPLYKVKFDANYTGHATFRIKFEGSDETQFVLPQGEEEIRYAFHNTAANPPVQHPLPFHIFNEEDLSFKTPEGVLLNSNIGSEPDGSYPYVTIDGVLGGSTSGYTGYVLTEYDALKPRYIAKDPTYPTEGEWITGLHFLMNPSIHEAMTIVPSTIEDYHDKLDGFVFPLSRIPWREVDGDTWDWKWDGGTGDFEEIFPIGNTVEFDDTATQFYYYKKKLYTNFNLLDYQGLSITYPSMATGIKVIIDLYGDAKVDDYYLEFIEAEEPIIPYSVDMIPSSEPSSPTPDDELDEEGGY